MYQYRVSRQTVVFLWHIARNAHVNHRSFDWKLAKADVIEYLADHANDKNRRHFALTDKQGGESKC